MQKNTKPAKKTENLSDERAAFVERLNFCVEKVGSVAALARGSGVSAPSIADYLSGSDPSRERVIAIARAAGVSFLWLGTGEGPADPKEAVPFIASKIAELQVEPHLAGSLVKVPVMSVTASAGDGAAVLQEDVQEYMTLSNLLVRSLRLTPSDTFIILARGESMEPMIRGGEPLLCSRAERHLKISDGVYIIRLEGDIMVKHIQKLPGGKVRVFSENSSYAPFEVELHDGTDFTILAKVLHGIRQIGS